MKRFSYIFIIVLVCILSCYCYIQYDRIPYAAKSLVYLVNRFVFAKQYLIATSSYGVKFKFKTPDAVGRIIYKNGTYEPEITNFILNNIKYDPNDIVIDVGANIGWYSLLLDRMHDGPGMIYAFEPDQLNYSLLKYNLNLNRSTKVIAVKQAIADKKGRAVLYQYKDSNLGRHSLLPLFAGQCETVITNTLDNYFREISNGKTIKLLKIDVEGYELPVLLGAQSILNHTENLVIEFSPDIMLNHAMKPELVIKLLYAKGFKPYLLNEREFAPCSKEELLKLHGILTIVWKK